MIIMLKNLKLKINLLNQIIIVIIQINMIKRKNLIIKIENQIRKLSNKVFFYFGRNNFKFKNVLSKIIKLYDIIKMVLKYENRKIKRN